jgi:oxygen-dependent protoporphyrinogen oxidase
MPSETGPVTDDDAEPGTGSGPDPRRGTVGIVGGGITGLALTHALAGRGVDCVTLEAADEPGGVIGSREVDGRVLEVGPQRVRKTPAVAALLDDLDLADRAVEADASLPLYVYADGQLAEAPLDRSAFLRTDLLSWRAKLRLLAEPLTNPGDPDEMAAELFTRKFGREAYERFVGPLYGGIYGSDPARMPARYALGTLLEREREAGSLLSAFRQRVGSGSEFPPLSFDAGMQALPEALTAAHANRVELGTAVTDVLPAESDGDESAASVPAPPYVIQTETGARTVDHVVVTTPADVAGELLAGVAAGASDLTGLTYNPLAVVHLVAEPDREGMGYQVGFGEDLRTLGCSWNASLFDRDGVYTVYLGGMHDPEILRESDEFLAETAAREFRTVMGAEPTAIDVSRLERGFPAYDESWAALDALDLPAGVHLATNYTARMGVPGRIREARELAADLGGDNGEADE